MLSLNHFMVHTEIDLIDRKDFSWFSSMQHEIPTPIMLQTHSIASMEVLCHPFQPSLAERGTWTHSKDCPIIHSALES